MEAGQERAGNSPLSQSDLINKSVPEDVGIFYGPLGEVVKEIKESKLYTDAPAEIILAHGLTYLGNVAGRRSYVQVGEQKLYPNIQFVAVGKSSTGRKGTSDKVAESIVSHALGTKISDVINVASNVTSGPAIIHAVRDSYTEVDKDGKETFIQGVDDKRLLIREPEFSSMLRTDSGMKTSETLRQAFDSDDFIYTAKHTPEKATKPHVSLIGHITPKEIGMLLGKSSVQIGMANGQFNRIMWLISIKDKDFKGLGKKIPKALVRKTLQLDWLNRAPSLSDIKAVFEEAEGVEKKLTVEAMEFYLATVRELNYEDHPHDYLFARAQSIILKVALIYAIIDGSEFIEVSHIKAARALWDLAETGATKTFCGQTPYTQKVLKALNESERLSHTEIRKLTGNRNPALRRKQVFDDLISAGHKVAEFKEESTTYWRLEK